MYRIQWKTLAVVKYIFGNFSVGSFSKLNCEGSYLRAWMKTFSECPFLFRAIFTQLKQNKHDPASRPRSLFVLCLLSASPAYNLPYFAPSKEATVNGQRSWGKYERIVLHGCGATRGTRGVPARYPCQQLRLRPSDLTIRALYWTATEDNVSCVR